MVVKTKHIDLNFRPLKISGSIEVMGSVPDSQVYQADIKEYTPDYTLTPLTLLPRCNATDPGANAMIGNVNAQLTNMKWYEIKAGVKALIDATNTGYVITDSGPEKGKLMVKKNISTIEPITLEFYGEYVNANRAGEKYIFQYRHLLHSVDGSDAIPTLVIDSPAGLNWIPYREEVNQTITAKVLVAGKDVTDSAQCNIFWYRVLDATNLQPVKMGGNTDYEVVSLTKNKLTINRNYIGPDMTYLVKASYAQEGAAPSQPDDAIGYQVTTIRRKIPAIEADFKGVPNEVPEGTQYIYPHAIVRDTMGDIPNAEQYFRCSWYSQGSDGGLTYLGTGFKPKLPYSKGLLLRLDVQDIGPYCLVTVGKDTGRKVVTSNGKILVAKKLQP